MERALLEQIWPIFSAEAREHLQLIGEGVLDLEREPGRPGVADGVRRAAHSLKGSAASLGLSDVEALAHAIEGALAAADAAGLSRAAVQAALDAVQAIEEAIAAADAGGEPRLGALPGLVAALREAAEAGADAAAEAPRAPGPARTPRAPAPAATGPARPSPAALVEEVEHRLEALCAPLEPAEREALAVAGAEAAVALAAAAPPAAEPVARRIAASFAALAAGGPEAARVAAALAGDLVELRQALAPAAAPARAPVAPAAASPAASGGDRSVRVLTSTLDSLSRQLDLLVLGEGRHGRRARDLLAGEDAAREALREVERALSALRDAGPAVDGARAPLVDAAERLRTLSSELRRLGREGHRDAEQQRLAGAVLREDLRALRMVPAALVLEPLRRTVRDVAGRTGKEVELVLEGADVRLDRRIVDELRDPLLHLVRNAVDHGIEAPAARAAAGKPPRGRIVVRVEPRGSRVGVVVQDDGPGLDLAALRASAVRKGVLDADAAARLSDAEATRLVFEAGLSTRARATEFSGRGVGLDVVGEVAARLGGAAGVSFEPGRGTRFDLELPLTIAAAAVLLFRLGRDLAALPAEAVERVVIVRDAEVGTVAGRPTVRVGAAQIPYAPLAGLLGLQGGGEARGRRTALVLAAGTERMAVGVEAVLAQQEVVVSALGRRAARAAHLAGAAVLEDGRVVGVLSPAELLRRARPAEAGAGRAVARRVRVVVADDALTTRAAMKALLELAGYQVLPAADGEEAFAIARDAVPDLVVSDVQMPRLDGLGLTRRLKADARLRHVPVVLVTSLDAPEDRAAGLEAGADGYLVKREVERGKLLELVRQLAPARP
jgi:two-component system chemotaxis sensor kinase CheA